MFDKNYRRIQQDKFSRLQEFYFSLCLNIYLEIEIIEAKYKAYFLII